MEVLKESAPPRTQRRDATRRRRRAGVMASHRRRAAALHALAALLGAVAEVDLDILKIPYGSDLDSVRREVADVTELSVEAVKHATDLEELSKGAQEQHADATFLWKHFIYGEVLPSSVAAMLETLGAQPGSRYYDLGAGDGKTAAVAWLHGLHAVGIELVEHRFNASCGAVATLREALSTRTVHGAGSLRMLHGSFLDLDWSDADLVFVASVTFNEAMMHELAVRARRLRRGARIVSWKPFPGPEFQARGTVHLSASWQAWGDEEAPLPFTLQEKMVDPPDSVIDGDDQHSEDCTARRDGTARTQCIL